MASHGIPRVSATAADRSEQAKEKERKQIEQYKSLEKDVGDRVASKDFSGSTLQAISNLLTQNPEYYSIWNYRRLVLQDAMSRELSSEQDPAKKENLDEKDIAAAEKAGLTIPQREILLLVREDLQFLLPLLKQFPKCYWIWNHRSWLLGTATKHLPTASSVELWQGELGLVTKMLGLDSRNFHGWGYRREVVQELERLSQRSMVESEFEYTTKMINSNLSNFSAWHYRSQLIPRLLRERDAAQDERKKMLDSEFELITRALYTDPYDQSLWFYHQYLMSTLDAENAQSAAILEPSTNEDRLEYLEQELDSIRDMLDGAEDCKYIYQALLEYSRRYLEVDAGNKKVTTAEMTSWLAELRKIDPMREGRWKDLETKMKL
ncbi:protein prenylyltransferase [Hortaea werneckii]|nr:protein prenylyltransferase [Hortaea werneckii]KAI7106452.1 protein prenylyltransferase [Hortaea werneckii]KAI7237524.1 protein prenylyltransferase [Hortaea werneckii]KAI7320959.1 protein prenylyltransferase [Hortaea werneckii]KAI7373577.1 protein prenylyltransferase [Hortaea werneckii]